MGNRAQKMFNMDRQKNVTVPLMNPRQFRWRAQSGDALDPPTVPQQLSVMKVSLSRSECS